MQELDELQLIQKAKRGQDEAFEVLVARYFKLVYNFAFGFLKNRTDAEDATQETFVKLWKNLSKFNEDKAFRSWLYEIAKNTCLDMLRKKTPGVVQAEVWSEESGEWLAWPIEDQGARPEVLTDQNLLRDKFARLAGRLSPEHVRVLKMYHEDGWNFRQISQKTRQSINTVKSQYYRAVRQLRKLWK